MGTLRPPVRTIVERWAAGGRGTERQEMGVPKKLVLGVSCLSFGRRQQPDSARPGPVGAVALARRKRKRRVCLGFENGRLWAHRIQRGEAPQNAVRPSVSFLRVVCAAPMRHCASFLRSCASPSQLGNRKSEGRKHNRARGKRKAKSPLCHKRRIS